MDLRINIKRENGREAWVKAEIPESDLLRMKPDSFYRLYLDPAFANLRNLVESQKQEESKPAQAPMYRCHKQVRAAKILQFIAVSGGIRIVTEEGIVVVVTQSWLDKHEAQVGGYVVFYGDGYKSYSPAKAFEEGYTRIG